MIKFLAAATCAGTLLFSPVAFAQSAGTSLGGTSNGAQGTPGQNAASGSSDMRGPGTAGSSGGSGGASAGTGQGTANTTATGGNAGGNASRN